ncbi:MAG: LysM peptidoglycan-binding domain-containing protein, partial [Phycisphaerales bacterium]
MALASQAPRSTASVRASSRPSGGSGGSRGPGPSTRTKLILIAAAGTIVAFVAYGLSRSSGPAKNTDTTAANANATTDPNKAATSANSLPNTSANTPANPAAALPPATVTPPKLTMGEPPTNTLVPPPAIPGTPATNPTKPEATPGPTPGNPPSNTPPGTPVTTPGSSAPGSGPTTPAAPPVPSGPPVESNSASREAREAVENATRAISAGRPLEARTLLNRALMNRDLPASERNALRAQIGSLNESLVFSPTVTPGDPICDTYTIAEGDYLATIVGKQGIPVEWQLLQRINRVNPSALRIGQKIKVIRQPLHAIVHKSDYRMDIYAGDPLSPGATAQTGPDGQDASWTFIRSFRVGLGESDGTPEGTVVIKPRSK